MREAASRGLLSAAQKTVAYIKTDIIPTARPFPPIARGTYQSAWKAEKDGLGAVVLNDSPHAIFVEYGVRGANVKPGRAMITALAEWVRMKGLGGSTRTGKGGTVLVTRATTTEATQIAWAIATSMKKHGIFAQGNGLGIFKRAKAKIPQFIREEVAAEIGRMFK
jgi:hypothetical protein